MEFITIDDWKTYAGLNKPTVDSSIPGFISAANALVTQLLGIDDSTATVDLLPTRPSRVKYFMSSPGPNVVTNLKINDAEVDPNNFKVYPDGTIFLKFSPPTGYMEVTYTPSAYSSGIPEDLKLATLLVVDHWFKQDYRESRTIGGETVQYNTRKSGIPEHIRTIIEVHRRM